MLKTLQKLTFFTLFLYYTCTFAQDSSYMLRSKLSGHGKNVEVVAYSPDGKMLATGGFDNKVLLYEIDSLQQYKLKRTLTENLAGITTLYWSKDGKLLATGSKDFSVRVYDVQNNFQVVFTANDHKDAVTKVFIDNKGKFLYSASQDGFLRIYDLLEPKNNVKPRFVKHSSAITSFLPSPDLKFYYIASKTGDIIKVDFKGTTVQTLSGHKGQVNCLVYSSDMKSIFSGSNDKNIMVWNVATGKSEKTLSGHGWNVTGMDVSSDGKHLVSTSNDGEVLVWDLAEAKILTHILDLGDDARSASFHPALHSIAMAVSHDTGPFGAVVYKTPFVKMTPKPKPVPKTTPKPGDVVSGGSKPGGKR